MNRKALPGALCTRSVEFRATETEEPNDGRTLEGYAAVFNAETEIDSWDGSFAEEIAPGAFKKTIRESTPVLQFDHGRDQRTGTVPIGSFEELKEDATGLYVRARLFDNPVVEPIRQAIEGGAISGMSFRFQILRDVWTDNGGKRVKEDELHELLWRPGDRGPLKRTIKEVKLFEAGPVVFPAYAQTSVGVRSLLDDLNDEQIAELRNLLEKAETPEEEIAGTPSSEEREEGPGAVPEETAVVNEDTVTPESTPALTGAALPRTPDSRDVSSHERDSAVHMTVEERAVRQAEIKARLAEIDTEFSGAQLPDETQTEWDGLVQEDEEHRQAIDAAETRRKQLAALTGDKPRAIEYGSDRGGARPSRATVRKAENIYDLSEIRRMAYGEDDLVGLYRDHAKRVVERGRYGGGVAKEEAQGHVERLIDAIDDEEGTLAKRLISTGSPTYERAFGKVLKTLSPMGLTMDEQRALSLGTDANGGYAVPFQLDPSVILTSDGVINPLRSMARIVQIVGKEWQGLTSAGVTVSRTAEVAEATDNSPTFTQPTVRAKAVHAWIPFSMDLESDWGQMRSELTTLLNDGKDTEEATAFVTGDGTGNNPNGIVGTLADTSYVPVATTAVFAAADVYALEESLAPRWRARAQFLALKSVYNKIRQFDTSGGAQLWERIGAGQPSQLLGYPARESSEMPTPALAVDDSPVLLFGDFSQFLIVDRVGMSVELVPHVFGATNRFPNGQRGIYARWRNNSKVLVDNAFRLLVGNDGTP